MSEDFEDISPERLAAWAERMKKAQEREDEIERLKAEFLQQEYLNRTGRKEMIP